MEEGQGKEELVVARMLLMYVFSYTCSLQGAMDIIQHAHSELDEVREELQNEKPERHALISELGDLLFNAMLLVCSLCLAFLGDIYGRVFVCVHFENSLL